MMGLEIHEIISIIIVIIFGVVGILLIIDFNNNFQACREEGYRQYDSGIIMDDQEYIRCCRNVIEDDDFVQDCAIFKKEET